jgi:hypothetical protein
VVALTDSERRRRQRGARPVGRRAPPGPDAAWSQRRWGGGGLMAAVHGDSVSAADGDMQRAAPVVACEGGGDCEACSAP